jgi:hypothetical protein
MHANGAKRFDYLRAIADIATEIQHRGPALPDLAGECLQIVRCARENGDSVACSGATDECGAESRANSSNDRNRLVRQSIHTTPLCLTAKRLRARCALLPLVSLVCIFCRVSKEGECLVQEANSLPSAINLSNIIYP